MRLWQIIGAKIGTKQPLCHYYAAEARAYRRAVDVSKARAVLLLR